MAKKKKVDKKPAPKKKDDTLKVNASFEQLLQVVARSPKNKKNK